MKDDRLKELLELWEGLSDYYKSEILEDARTFASQQRKEEYRRAWRMEQENQA